MRAGVTDLPLAEPARFNPSQLELLCDRLGEHRAEAEVAYALERIAKHLSQLGLDRLRADRAALEQSTFERTLLPDRPAKPTDWSVPDSLAKYPHAQAELRASGKRNNFLSALVGRIPPVPGVLAYDRDVPVDLVGLAEQNARVEVEAAMEAEAADAPAAKPEPTPAPAP